MPLRLPKAQAVSDRARALAHYGNRTRKQSSPFFQHHPAAPEDDRGCRMFVYSPIPPPPLRLYSPAPGQQPSEGGRHTAINPSQVPIPEAIWTHRTNESICSPPYRPPAACPSAIRCRDNAAPNRARRKPAHTQNPCAAPSRKKYAHQPAATTDAAHKFHPNSAPSQNEASVLQE